MSARFSSLERRPPSTSANTSCCNGCGPFDRMQCALHPPPETVALRRPSHSAQLPRLLDRNRCAPFARAAQGRIHTLDYSPSVHASVRVRSEFHSGSGPSETFWATIPRQCWHERLFPCCRPGVNPTAGRLFPYPDERSSPGPLRSVRGCHWHVVQPHTPRVFRPNPELRS